MKKLYIEIADTPIKREYGLMDRKSLASNRGMLFKFPQHQRLGFWMRDTYIPLDIAFIDDDGRISQIENMYPLSTRSIRSNKECKYALEVNAGWFKENGIKIGDKLCESALTARKLYSQVVKKKTEKKEVKKPEVIEPPPEEEEEENKIEGDIDAPEMEIEGNYPTSVYAAPVQEGETKPEVQYLRDMRGKIKFANDNNLNMIILYWTMAGHMLPPRRVRPLDKEGYVIKKGQIGELLVAFDTSATLMGDGWSIKGGQPKSFLIDNIVQLQILGKDGSEMTDEEIQSIRNPQQQPQQPQQGQNQQNQKNQGPEGLVDRLREYM